MAKIEVDFTEKDDVREITVTLRVLDTAVGDVIGQVGQVFEDYAIK